MTFANSISPRRRARLGWAIIAATVAPMAVVSTSSPASADEDPVPGAVQNIVLNSPRGPHQAVPCVVTINPLQSRENGERRVKWLVTGQITCPTDVQVTWGKAYLTARRDADETPTHEVTATVGGNRANFSGLYETPRACAPFKKYDVRGIIKGWGFGARKQLADGSWVAGDLAVGTGVGTELKTDAREMIGRPGGQCDAAVP